MKAQVLYDVGDIRLQEVEDPVPKEGEVLIKISHCGICGSDIPRVFETGAHRMPLIIGHEFSGTILEGRNKGRKASVFPLIPCGKCKPCIKRQFEMCKNYDYLGSRRDGGFAEYAAVPEGNLFLLPDDFPMDIAAMIEPMAVAVHAIRSARPTEDEKILVYGLGAIGLFVLDFLMDLLRDSPDMIYAVYSKAFQKEKAISLGLDTDHLISRDEIKAMEEDPSYGFDVIFECVGSNEVYSSAVGLTLPAGRVVLVGNPHSDMLLSKDTYWKILRNQLHIMGIWNSHYTGDKDDDWHVVRSKVIDGRVHPRQMITHRFDLKDLPKGLGIMKEKKEGYGRIIITPHEDSI